MATEFSANLALTCAFLILQTSAAPQNQSKSFEDLNVLMYGDSCSWEAEELRLEMSAYLLKGVNPPHNVAWRIVVLGQPLCNYLDLTVCNKATGKCDCGEPESVLVLGDKSRSSFTVEDGKCRFAVGAYCKPKDYHPALKRDAECAKGSLCIAKDTGKECTLQGITNATGSVNGKSEKDLMNANCQPDMPTGKYCTCTYKRNEGSPKKSTAQKVEEHMFLYFGAFQMTLYVFIYSKQ